MNNEQGLSGQNWFVLIRSILFSILDMVDPLQPTIGYINGMEIYYHWFGGKGAPLGGYFVTTLQLHTILVNNLIIASTALRHYVLYRSTRFLFTFTSVKINFNF